MMESQEEEEDIIITQEEEEEESEDEYEQEEEAEQLEEMKPPLVASWMGPDGITVHGLICIDDGIILLKNRCQLDDCSICYEPSTAHGKHQLCCLPCGHMYGFSCIKKWLLQDSSSWKCPQCNTFCSFQDAKLLYPSPLCVTAHQKAPPAAFFPFTEQGLLEYTNFEYSRMSDARLLRLADVKHMNILVTKYDDSVCRGKRLATHLVNLLRRAKELEERPECLGLVDVLRRRAYPLGPRAKALLRRTNALQRLVSALRRRIDALEQRSDAFESRMIFYSQMYDEHRKREEEIAKAEHALESKEKLAEKAAAKAKNKGEKEAEKVAEKKHKDKEKNGACESEKQKQQREGPDSISKVILKHKKSNNYMYYYAAGAAAVLIVPLAVGYTLYA